MRTRASTCCASGAAGCTRAKTFTTCATHYGILVWQDFPYACAYYPDTGEYAEAARAEATAAVRRIRNHPSLALWCGNNENHMHVRRQVARRRDPPRFLGEHLYHDILPAVVAAEDPQDALLAVSPFGGRQTPTRRTSATATTGTSGTGAATGRTTPRTTPASAPSSASRPPAAWPPGTQCLAPDDRHPHSPAVRWHDKTRKGYDTYLGYIGLHFPEPQTLEDLVYYSQINQAEALKCGVEHYRRRKGRCWGTLFWQINDCWPVQSWAVD